MSRAQLIDERPEEEATEAQPGDDDGQRDMESANDADNDADMGAADHVEMSTGDHATAGWCRRSFETPEKRDITAVAEGCGQAMTTMMASSRACI